MANPVGQAQEAQVIYTFNPQPNIYTARLPLLLEEAQRQDSGKLNNAKQRGVPCPRCQSTNTRFEGIRMIETKLPRRNKAHFRVPQWECLTASAVNAEVPCLLCPVCEPDAELRARIIHICPVDGEQKAIKPGKICAMCEYSPAAACFCRECARIKHPVTFHLIYNPDAPVDSAETAQRVPPGQVRENMWHNKKLKLEYDQQVIAEQTKERERLAAFTNLQTSTQQALASIAGDMGANNIGMRVLAELHRLDPGCLQNLGATAGFVARVQEFAMEYERLDILHFDPAFRIRQLGNLTRLARASERVGQHIFGLIETIQRQNAIRVAEPGDMERLRLAGLAAWNQANQVFEQNPAHAPVNAHQIPLPPELVPNQAGGEHHLMLPQGIGLQPVGVHGGQQHVQMENAVADPPAAPFQNANIEANAALLLNGIREELRIAMRGRIQAEPDNPELRQDMRTASTANNTTIGYLIPVVSDPTRQGHALVMNMLRVIDLRGGLEARVRAFNFIVHALRQNYNMNHLTYLTSSQQQFNVGGLFDEDPFADI